MTSLAPKVATRPVPAGWREVPDGCLSRARAAALAALDVDGPRPVGPRLAAFYDLAGNYAGAAFATLGPNDPLTLTATDLHAVSLMSVNVGPGATRRFLTPGPPRDDLLAALAQVPQVDLAHAGASDLSAMAHFYEQVKAHLADPRTADPNPWVTASKICARKRPALFPVRDSVVVDVLGLATYSSYQVDWQVFRALIGDPDVQAACRSALTAAQGCAGGRVLALDTEPLRILDAAVWTYPPRKNARHGT